MMRPAVEDDSSPKSSGTPKRSDQAPEELAEAHEAWQRAMEEVKNHENLAKVAIEQLLLGPEVLKSNEF